MRMKPYKVTRVATGRGTGLTCPRACGGKFIMNLADLGEKRERLELGNIKTIPCPYCFKVSLIPSE